MFAKTNAMKVLLVTTDHFLVRLWFKDDEDFRVASGDTAAERVIAYVQMNGMAADGPAVWVFAADWVTLFRYEETNSFRSGRDAAQYH